MNNTLYRCPRWAAVATIAAVLLLAFSGLAGAGGPSPLLIGSHWREDGHVRAGMLAGGLDTEATVDIFHFPIHVGDPVFTHGEIECPDVGEDAKAKTQLLPTSTRLVMYDLNGQTLGTGMSTDWNIHLGVKWRLPFRPPPKPGIVLHGLFSLDYPGVSLVQRIILGARIK